MKKRILKNYLRSSAGVLQILSSGYTKPLAVSLSVTDLCSNRCVYCNIPRRGFSGLPTEEILGMLKKLWHMGACRLVLTGGEPMMRNDISQILKFAGDLGYFVSLNTCGFRLTEHPDVPVHSDMIFISVDGKPQTHDAQRGKGAFNQAITAARFARDLGSRVVLTSVLTQRGISDIEWLADFVKDEGMEVDFEEFSPHPLASDKKLMNDMLPSQSDLYNANEKIRKLKHSGYSVLASDTVLKLIGRNDPESICYAGRAFIYIDTDGTAWPCFDMRGRGHGVPKDKWMKKEKFSVPELPCNFCRCNAQLELNRLLSLQIDSVFNVRSWL